MSLLMLLLLQLTTFCVGVSVGIGLQPRRGQGEKTLIEKADALSKEHQKQYEREHY